MEPLQLDVEPMNLLSCHSFRGLLARRIERFEIRRSRQGHLAAVSVTVGNNLSKHSLASGRFLVYQLLMRFVTVYESTVVFATMVKLCAGDLGRAAADRHWPHAAYFAPHSERAPGDIKHAVSRLVAGQNARAPCCG